MGQVVEPAAVVARLGALDGDAGELLAQGVGLALDVLDALERGGELGAGGLGLADAVALETVERGGELGAGGLGGLLVLGADLLELGDQLGLADLAGAGAAVLDLGEAGLDDRARLVGAASGLLDGLLGAALGLGDGGGQAGVGGGRGLGALALQAVEAGGELGACGLGDVERAAAVVRGLLGVELGALEPVEAGEQLLVVAGAAGGSDALDLGAQGGGLALGGLGAALGALAGLLELAGQAERDALELVDALHRRQQARHHGGGVVEIGDRVALDAGIEVGEALLDLGVGLGADGLAAGQLGRHPRRRLQRAEDDERAGRAPALPGLGLGLERLAHGAHHDRVLGAHALEHQVGRELEAEVLEEEREVEALVELDGDEDGLHREVVALDHDRGDLDAAGRGGRLAGLQEAAPRLGGFRHRGLDQRLEERLAEHLGGGAAEQQLGRLGPLGDRALAVGQHEVAADDLPQDVVQRIGGTAGQVIRCEARGDRGRGALDRGVHCLLYRHDPVVHSAIRRGKRPPRESRARPLPRPAAPVMW